MAKKTRNNMEREELLNLVNEELGNTQLTLSERTIGEELDDVLGDMGDDAEANAAVVKRVAARLKRMDGNLHADVSRQVADYKKNYKPQPKPAAKKAEKDSVKGSGEADGEGNDELRQIRAELASLKAESEERKRAEARNGVVKDVRKALDERFAKAGMKVNEYFMRGALQSLDVPDGPADIDSLATAAEKRYNADMKEAGVHPDQSPRYGRGGEGGTNSASDYFARKAKKEGWGKGA